MTQLTSRPVRLAPPPIGVLLLLGLVLLVGLVMAAAPTREGSPTAGLRPAATPSAARSGDAAARPAAPGTAPSPTPPPEPPQLPRGGTKIFPRHRLVGFAGGPGTAAFGRLGVGRIDDRVAEIERFGAKYTAGRQPLPVLELITVVAQAKPGRDRMYRARVDDAVITAHLAAARRHRGILLLNVQPGRADFLTEVQGLERWLREPDVGVALDPEWAVGPGQVPGQVYGRTDWRELDAVAAYLERVVAAHRLPQKVMVVHQLAPRIISNVGRISPRPHVPVIVSVDGIGGYADKLATWRRIVAGLPPHVRAGFKLFFEEDAEHGALMTPRQVLGLRPEPEYVLYE